MFGAKLYNIVPCGKCYQCQCARQEDWFVRCFFEWQNSHNCTYFYTLTYNEENLPLYHGYRCFDKHEVQNFFKRLRKYLAKYSITFKYLISCEFGELYKRPHYHVLFFLNMPISPIVLRKVINIAWGHGFCVPGDNLGLVDSSKGIKYVTKYITKDDSFVLLYEKKFARMLLFHWYKKYLNEVTIYQKPPKGKLYFDTSEYLMNNAPTYMVTWNNYFMAAKRDFDQKMPFHLQSSGLGISAKERITSDFQDKLNLVGIGSRNIPRYIRRKLWMDKMPDLINDGQMNKFALSSEGREHQLKTFDFNLQNQISRNAENISYLRTLKAPAIREILKMMRVNYFCADALKMFQKSVIAFLDSSENRELLALYMSVYRNRCCPYAMDETFGTKKQFLKNKRKWFIRTIYDMSICNLGFAKNQLNVPLTECEDVIFMNDNAMFRNLPADMKLREFLEFRLWNNHAIFQDCENFAILLDTLECHRRIQECNDRKRQDNAVRRLRQKYKHKNF